jgi:hypothetical protein
MGKMEYVKMNRKVSRQLQKEGNGFSRSGVGAHGGDKREMSKRDRKNRKQELRNWE